MGARAWAVGHFWGRAAFTLTFFIVAVALFIWYRILYAPLIFPGSPWLSIGAPAFVAALLMSIIVNRVVRIGNIL